MALPSKFLPWICCVAWLCSQAVRGESQVAASAELESEAKPWSLLQPVDGQHGAGSLLPLFKVLSDKGGRARELQPDARALHYMKKLYKTYATKEGIPKSTRSRLYNTVRLFTPYSPQRHASGAQVTGALPSVDLLFSLDRVATVEHLLKSVLLYTFNNSGSLSSVAKCLCTLLIMEPKSSSKTSPSVPYSLNFHSQFELRKNSRWIEIDVTSLLQPLVASNERSIHMSVNFTCRKDRRGGLFHMTFHVPPSLILYLNDTSMQAYHRWYSLRSKRGSLQGPGHGRKKVACVMGKEDRRSSPPRRGRETSSSKLQKPLLPASFNLSEYFRQIFFSPAECELHNFKLSFRQLKWDNWIVAPHRYNPRYCKGDCPRAVRHRYGSPVHTVVQNIIYEKLDPLVPRPSCVPATYNPLSVLTIEPDASIAYKEYENMIATQCTCR
ncbi:growth/differentiation factor 9 [Ctenodactylus gundi]